MGENVKQTFQEQPDFDNPDLEAGMDRLRQIVTQIQEPDLSLERSIELMQEAQRLGAQLHRLLNEAELVISRLDDSGLKEVL